MADTLFGKPEEIKPFEKKITLGYM